jgi:hypothetical protein
VSLVESWDSLADGLPADWAKARVELRVTSGDVERAAALLGPAQPWRAPDGALRFDLARDGSARGPSAIKRLVARLDQTGIEGELALVSTEGATAHAAAEERSLAESWDDALATVPTDWSDLVGEIDLISSDYLDLGALQLAPINPRRVPGTLTLRFRCAAKFGYGASSGMVRRCLERCDANGIRGRVRVVLALSDTRPVGTQGPVWQIGGRTV